MTFQGTGLDWRYGKIAAMLSLLLVVALTNGGCSLVILEHDIEATDLTPLHVGATRAEVEEVLGKPVASEAKGTQYVVTYEFDRGQQHEPSKEYLRGYEIPRAYILLLEPILTPVALAVLARRVDEQKCRLPVTYGPDDTVIRLGPLEVRGEPEDGEELLSRAWQGDAEAQYSLGLLDDLTDAERWKWSCLAAQQNHTSAQDLIGYYYKLGHFVGVDVVQASLWYKLALANGKDSATWHIDDLAKHMTPAQITEAERLVREWKSDPASCDLEVDQATSE